LGAGLLVALAAVLRGPVLTGIADAVLAGARLLNARVVIALLGLALGAYLGLILQDRPPPVDNAPDLDFLLGLTSAPAAAPPAAATDWTRLSIVWGAGVAGALAGFGAGLLLDRRSRRAAG